ncbi:MAG: DUF4905 domain-containing protein [Cytophagales bacterium]|nr:MAG: DUF4905 domain-containing protein [Cytophagales bacterium]
MLSYIILHLVQSNFITTFDFPSKIWQVHAHPNLPILILEFRNSETRTCSFTCLQMDSNQILWSNPDLEEDWWRGLETMDGDYAVFYGFEDAQQPTRKGVFVLSLKTGAKVFFDENIFFDNIHQHILFYKKTNQEELLYGMDLRNLQHFEIVPSEIYYIKDTTNLQSPILVYPEDILFPKLMLLLEQHFPTHQVQMMEYLETNKYLIISFSEKGNEQLNQHLLLINADGNLLIQEVLGISQKGLLLGTFFVAHHHLVFVSKENTLNYYLLI